MFIMEKMFNYVKKFAAALSTAAVSAFSVSVTASAEGNSAFAEVSEHIDNIWMLLYIVTAAAVIIIAAIVLRNKRSEHTDRVTGGINKQKFLEDTEKLVRKTSPKLWALIIFDINNFKYVNDKLGFDEGNRMLERVYKVLSKHLSGDERAARISDDKFVFITRNMSDEEITAKLNRFFEEFDSQNKSAVNYPVVFSAGVCRLEDCFGEGENIDMNIAIDRCSIAKNTLKGQHCSSIAFYDGKVREKALREKDYENAMPSALKDGEFECYLQPKYGLASRHIEGAEALIRWKSAKFGFVFPNDFIPISERNGFVVELDFYILEEVCKSMRKWMDQGLDPVVISVNQSRIHIDHEDYIPRLRKIVDKYNVPYSYIELELTETVFTEDTKKLIGTMDELHKLGFKLSLDDFGSGYSSLNLIKDVPVDVVKIDRGFFSSTVNSEKGRAVISTVVDLARSLNMEVLSEGVETAEQVEFLAEIKCEMVQGFYFAKPMTIPDFEKLWYSDIEEYAREKERKEGKERVVRNHA